MIDKPKNTVNVAKKVMTLRDVADYLGVHSSTVYKYAREGRIPAFKIGSDWRFSKKHIDKWIDEKMSSGESEKGN